MREVMNDVQWLGPKFRVRATKTAKPHKMHTHTKGGRNSFRIRTYGLLDLKSFRMRTYENDGGG